MGEIHCSCLVVEYWGGAVPPCIEDDGRQWRSASSYQTIDSDPRGTVHGISRRGAAPRGKHVGRGCPPPLHRLPNGAVMWPVANFRMGFSPRKITGNPLGSHAAKGAFRGVKTQSICSRRGTLCMLLQVKFLPLRGISIKPRLLIISLKIIMPFILPPSLFLSDVDI